MTGVIAGVLVGVFLVINVRSQPVSRQSNGGELALDLVWLGLVYGMIDALSLNVMPVLAVWHGFAEIGWTTSLGREGARIVLAKFFRFVFIDMSE